MRLDGKVAIVTAATRGIGLACAQRLAREGAVVYIGARNMERAAERADELNKEGCNVKTVYNDASKKETYASMVEEVIKNEGKIDILVNNFGTSNPKKDLDIKSTEYDEYIRTIDMNLASVFLSAQAVILLFRNPTQIHLFQNEAYYNMYCHLKWKHVISRSQTKTSILFIAQNAPDLYGALIVTGIFSHIAIQVILNVAVVVNLIPNTGITLPFISYGGTSVLFLMIEMGIALGVSRKIKIEE